MAESAYKLRKRIEQLERENSRLKEFKIAVLNIFDDLCSCPQDKYIPPLQIIKRMRRLLW